ncbi:MAG: Gx transporter family protein [Bacteroides sp.]|nr:Gx transporter family protein [Bacteroides sp.]
MKIRRLTELSLLTAVSLIIFIVELRIPNLSPIAGVKLGLANIITVYAVYRYKWSETALMLLARILLGALFASNPSTVIYSLSGGFMCLLGMLFLKKIIPMEHLWLCSVFGAVLHNIGQLAAAMLIMRTSAVLFYLPLLILSGCIAGAVTGLAAQLVLKRITKKSLKKSQKERDDQES